LPIGDGAPKAPHQLKLTLVDNGKIIIQIGSIAGYWLRDFWPSDPPQVWHWHSIVARKRFWDTVLENMAKIGDNRLGPEDRKRIRREIHRTVPWVMKWELKRAELFEHEHDCKYVKGQAERTERQIADYKEYTVRLQKENIKRAKALSAHLRFMSDMAAEVKKLRDTT
jgi:hypothetical protein